MSIAHGEEGLLRAIEAGLARPWPTLLVESAWLVEDTPAGWRPHTAFPLNRHKLL